jgi:hypothetical protein
MLFQYKELRCFTLDHWIILLKSFLFSANIMYSTKLLFFIIISSDSAARRGLWPPRFMRFLDHTQRRATVGRTSLDE